jgi:hypothetical protein
MDITEKAREKLQEVLKDNPGKCLRVFIQGHG